MMFNKQLQDYFMLIFH